MGEEESNTTKLHSRKKKNMNIKREREKKKHERETENNCFFHKGDNC
jgi:hypothetical protein